MTTEVEQAVQKAMAQRDAEEKAKAEVDDKEVTGSVIFWAIAWALIIPIVGTIIGIVNLVQGKSSKGWTYIGCSIAGWVLSFIILSS